MAHIDTEYLIAALDQQLSGLRATVARLEKRHQRAGVGVVGASRRGKSALIARLSAVEGWPIALQWVELPGYGGVDFTSGALLDVSLAPVETALANDALVLALFVSMADPPLNRDDQDVLALLAQAQVPLIFVQTKIDVADPDQWPDNALEAAAAESRIYRVSNATGAGIDDLIEALGAQPWPALVHAAGERARQRVLASVTHAYNQFRRDWDELASQEQTLSTIQADYLVYLHQMTVWLTAQEQTFAVEAQAEISRAVRASSPYVLRSREGLLLIYDLLRQKAAVLVRIFEARVAEFQNRAQDISHYYQQPFPEQALANAIAITPPDPAEGRIMVRVADRDRQLALYMQMVTQIADDYTNTLLKVLRKALHEHAAILQGFLRPADDFAEDMQLMAERDVVFMELVERLQATT